MTLFMETQKNCRARLQTLLAENHFRDPLLTEIMRRIDESGMAYKRLTGRAGVNRKAVENIMDGHKPQLLTVQCLMEVIGYRLVLEPIAGVPDEGE